MEDLWPVPEGLMDERYSYLKDVLGCFEHSSSGYLLLGQMTMERNGDVCGLRGSRLA